MVRRVLIVGVGLLVLVLGALAMVSRGEARPPSLEGHLDVQIPHGTEAPVPAVILMSGCGGLRQIQDDYAAIALEQGWAAVIVDSFGARDIGRRGALNTVCTALRMRGDDRAQDIFQTIDRLREDPRIDTETLALIGWSHGSWAILDAMAIARFDDAPEGALAGVRGAFAIYPYCGFLSVADTHPMGDEIELMILNVGRDRVVNTQACRDLAEARAAEGTPVTVIEEPELTHAFDEELDRWDPRMRHDPEGTARNHARFAAFLTGLEG
jgi:dienelactone hydrolase